MNFKPNNETIGQMLEKCGDDNEKWKTEFNKFPEDQRSVQFKLESDSGGVLEVSAIIAVDSIDVKYTEGNKGETIQ